VEEERAQHVTVRRRAQRPDGEGGRQEGHGVAQHGIAPQERVDSLRIERIVPRGLHVRGIIAVNVSREERERDHRERDAQPPHDAIGQASHEELHEEHREHASTSRSGKKSSVRGCTAPRPGAG